MIHRCTKNSWLLATTNTLLSSICKDTTYFNYDLLSMRSGGILCHHFECEALLFTLVTDLPQLRHRRRNCAPHRGIRRCY